MFTRPGKTKAKTKPARWTVMLYVAANHSRIEQAAITETAAVRDIEELLQVGSTDDVKILVQIDRRWPGYPERYWIKKGQSVPYGAPRNVKIPSSGDPRALKDFVDWARSEHPADHAMLVLWGHAFGLGFGRDQGDALTMPELSKAIYAGDKYGIDILGANACAMSYAEAAYELRRAATFLVAPEITMPFAGWPYEKILKRMFRSDIKPAALAEHIVTDYVDSFGRQGVALTLLDLTKAPPLREHLKALTLALKGRISSARLGESIAEAFVDTAHGSVRPLIDLVDLCDRLADIDNGSIRTAADAMREYLRPGADKFVLKYDGDPDLEGLHGLGIYAPSITGAADLTRLGFDRESYEKLDLVKPRSNPWTKLVYDDLAEALDPMNKAIAEFVKGTGATGKEERTGVAQLVMSVHRSFVKLDRALRSAQQQVIDLVDGTAVATSLGATNGKALVQGNGHTKGGSNGKNFAPFGPPYLRLASRYRPPQYASAKAAVEGTNGGTAVITETEDLDLQLAVAPLAALEDALANVERTARRVMTNERFGLGEDQVKAGLGNFGEDQVKPGLGEDQVKAGLGNFGEDQVKPGLGEDQVKAGLGILSRLIEADGDAVASTPIGTITALYRQVALALHLSEEAVANIESLVQSLPMSGAGYQDVDSKKRWIDQVTRAFRELKDMVDNAKSTTVSVLVHPTYGLGPSPQVTQGTLGREQLAIAGGLSSRVLRLM
jgi:Clostripain family